MRTRTRLSVFALGLLAMPAVECTNAAIGNKGGEAARPDASACEADADASVSKPDADASVRESDAQPCEPDAQACQPDAWTIHPDAATKSGAPPACGATPTLLVDFATLAKQVGAMAIGAPGLAVDATSVYFVFNDTLMRVPVRGGAAVQMLRLSVTNPILLLAVNDPLVTSTHVILHYPQASGDELVVSVPIAGGSPATLATSSGRITAFGGGEPVVYFVDGHGLEGVPAEGGSVQLLTGQLTSSTTFGSLAVAGSSVIATTSAQCGFQCSAARTSAGGPRPRQPGQPGGVGGPGAIAKLTARCGLTTVAQAPNFASNLVFDGTDFFETVGCDDCDGTLVRIPASGGPSATMGPGIFVAVDDSCAYWSTHAGISSAVKSYTFKQ